MDENYNVTSFEDLAKGITLEKDFEMLLQCVDALYWYLNGHTEVIRKKYTPGSDFVTFRCQRLVASLLSAFPVPSHEEEDMKKEAHECLTKIKNNIPFWKRYTLRREFEIVTNAINKMNLKLKILK